jgi:hypothetical protein
VTRPDGRVTRETVPLGPDGRVTRDTIPLGLTCDKARMGELLVILSFWALPVIRPDGRVTRHTVPFG